MMGSTGPGAGFRRGAGGRARVARAARLFAVAIAVVIASPLGVGPVLDHGLQGARPPLVELQTAGDRLHAHLHVLDVDAGARHFHDQVVHDLVEQHVAGGPCSVNSAKYRLMPACVCST